MINFWTIFLVALALSMDALSVAISLGINCVSFKKSIFFITLVGFFHFILPYLGMILGKSFLLNIILNSEKILGLILILLAFEMVYNYFHNEEKNTYSSINIVFLALTVSLDSFMTGIGLYNVKHNLSLILGTFSITSALFSIIGIFLGDFLNKHIGKYSELIGIIILFALGVKFLVL